MPKAKVPRAGAAGAGGVGNTKTPPNRVHPSVHWGFTWNNYVVPLVPVLEGLLSPYQYAFQEETGSTGTVHLQGYVNFGIGNKVRPMSIVDIKEIHWYKVDKPEAGLAYAIKEETRTGKIWTNIILPRKVKDPLEGKILYPWQQEIMDIIKEEPDDRKIYWYWEPKGCAGKTSMAKHICMTRNAIVLSGKSSDVKHGVASHIEKKGWLDVAIFNITRTQQDFVSFEAIEAVKDGIFFSGKYEGTMQVFAPPHIICFANFEPDLNKLSRDRWAIRVVGSPNDRVANVVGQAPSSPSLAHASLMY